MTTRRQVPVEPVRLNRRSNESAQCQLTGVSLVLHCLRCLLSPCPQTAKHVVVGAAVVVAGAEVVAQEAAEVAEAAGQKEAQASVSQMANALTATAAEA